MPKNYQQFHIPKQDILEIVRDILVNNYKNIDVQYRSIDKEIVLLLDNKLIEEEIRVTIGKKICSQIIIFQDNSSQKYIKRKDQNENENDNDNKNKCDYNSSVSHKNKPIKKINRKEKKLTLKKHRGWRIGNFNFQLK